MRILSLGAPVELSGAAGAHDVLRCDADEGCSVLAGRACPCDQGVDAVAVCGDVAASEVTGLGCAVRAGLPIVAIGAAPAGMAPDLLAATLREPTSWDEVVAAAEAAGDAGATAVARRVCAVAAARLGVPAHAISASVRHHGRRLTLEMTAAPEVDESLVTRVATQVHAAVTAIRPHIDGADVSLRRSC